MAGTEELRACLRLTGLRLDNLPGDRLWAQDKIPGISTPFLYMSDLAASVFVLHVEDHYLYALNLLFGGSAKNWIVVAPEHRAKLEDHLRPSMRHAFGGYWPMESCSQFARHLRIVVPPAVLVRWEIPFTHLRQRAGEMVVVAPGAYHQGWNEGANLAESANYATYDYEQHVCRYQRCHRRCQPMFEVPELSPTSSDYAIPDSPPVIVISLPPPEQAASRR